MFTGIIKGVIKADRIKRNTRGASLFLRLPFKAQEGDSFSVNGVCLTVFKVSGKTSVFRAVQETLRGTNLSMLKVGDWVNIEPSLRIGDSIHGHLLLGHIDGTGKIKEIKKTPSSIQLLVEYPLKLKKFIAEKGSIALDGISLTVAGLFGNEFQVTIVPYTMFNTNLQYKRIGDLLNIEIDPIARYIEKIMEEE